MASESTELHHNPIVIACGADNNYAIPLAVTLYSALVNLEKGVTIFVYVIDGGITEENRKRIESVLDLSHINLHLKWVVPQDFTSLIKQTSNIGKLAWVSEATYLRLLVADIVEEKFDKAIYLDADMLVNANLQNLWNEKIGDYALLASTDFGNPYVSSTFGLINYRELGLESDAPYFNGGVLVINLKRWRKEKIREQVIQYLCDNASHIQLCDQEGLNAILANDWDKLDPKWNVLSTLLNYEQWEESTFKQEILAIKEDLISKAYIFHFAGGAKPWEIGCEHPAQLQWIRYLQASRWFKPIEGILWFVQWFMQYYLWTMKILFKKFLFAVGLGTVWNKFRILARR